jgi:hypothetical protein
LSKTRSKREYNEVVGRYQDVCDELLAASNASLVALLDESGRELARAGHLDGFDTAAVARSFTVMLAANGEFTSAFHEGDRVNLHVALAAAGMIVAVVFDTRSSLGLVRLRVKKAIEDLSRASGPGSPGSGGSGAAGAPAHAPKLPNN